jgi:Tfp pilus assembly protein PilV
MHYRLFKPIQKQTGFSLFEVIVYLAIISVVMTAVLSIVARSVLNRVKAETIYSVTSSTRYAVERMTQDIRSAADIDETDLASNILTVESATGEIRSYQVVDGQLVVSTNGATAIPLTPTSLTVEAFSLADRTTVGTEINAVELTLSLASASTNPRPEYQADFSLTTTVSTRL